MYAVTSRSQRGIAIGSGRWLRFTPDTIDLLMVVALYVLAVATFRIAFSVITTDAPIPLSIVFGVVGLLLLGIGYAAVFRLAGNILVLWPLLIPLGSFFNKLESGDIELPWASMIGFSEMLAAMGAVLWFAHRVEMRRRAPARPVPQTHRRGAMGVQ